MGDERTPDLKEIGRLMVESHMRPAIDIALLQHELEVTKQERDLFKGMLVKVLDATVDFSAAFRPVMPESALPGWDAQVENIKGFRSQLG